MRLKYLVSPEMGSPVGPIEQSMAIPPRGCEQEKWFARSPSEELPLTVRWVQLGSPFPETQDILIVFYFAVGSILFYFATVFYCILFCCILFCFILFYYSILFWFIFLLYFVWSFLYFIYFTIVVPVLVHVLFYYTTYFVSLLILLHHHNFILFLFILFY
jgi:hypothetical protein